MNDAPISTNVRDTLLHGFLAHEANNAVMTGARRGDFDHAGDPLGKVIAWLWETDPDAVALNLAEYLRELRDRTPTAPITLEDVLGALHFAKPAAFSSTDYAMMCDRARAEVPRYYGGPVN